MSNTKFEQHKRDWEQIIRDVTQLMEEAIGLEAFWGLHLRQSVLQDEAGVNRHPIQYPGERVYLFSTVTDISSSWRWTQGVEFRHRIPAKIRLNEISREHISQAGARSAVSKAHFMLEVLIYMLHTQIAAFRFNNSQTPNYRSNVSEDTAGPIKTPNRHS